MISPRTRARLDWRCMGLTQRDIRDGATVLLEASKMLKNVASMVSTWAAVAGLCSLLPGSAHAVPVSAANTTLFGPNVYVFDTSMPAADIQTKANSIFKQMEANQFGTERYALLFKP